MIINFEVTSIEKMKGIVKHWFDGEFSYYKYFDGHIDRYNDNEYDDYEEDKWDYFFKDNPIY